MEDIIMRVYLINGTDELTHMGRFPAGRNFQEWFPQSAPLEESAPWWPLALWPTPRPPSQLLAREFTLLLARGTGAIIGLVTRGS